jgi:hypothetical protein
MMTVKISEDKKSEIIDTCTVFTVCGACKTCVNSSGCKVGLTGH